MKGICRICGNNRKLTFEHIPPKSAYNSTPVHFQKSEHIHNSKSPLYGKSIRSNQGAGGYYLCKSCNNNTGSWYGASYKEFVNRGIVATIHSVQASDKIEFIYNIAPLNILKQILSMFMCLDSSDQLLNHKGLSEFILNKESQEIPADIRVFAYYTSSKTIRNGWGILKSNIAMHTLGEITFAPFGFMYTIDSPPVKEEFCEITNFNRFYFNKRVPIKMLMPFIVPKTYIPGVYL